MIAGKVLERCLVLAQAVCDEPLPSLALSGAVIWVCSAFAFLFQCPKDTQVPYLRICINFSTELSILQLFHSGKLVRIPQGLCL